MNIRPKTIRRLLILFATFVLAAGGLVAWVAWRLHAHQLQVADIRVHAMQAYQEQDYSRAVSLLNNYLTLDHDAQDHDPEAVFAYGDSRAKVPMPARRQIVEAIGIFERCLQIDPADSRHDVRHKLLKLYGEARYNKEARTLAAWLLAKNPNDAAALRGDVQALVNDRNYADALTACHRLNQIEPLDLSGQRQELELMAQLSRPADELVARASQLRREHPNDPRFEALMAIAYAHAKRYDEARKSLEAAAALPPADTDSVLLILNLLDLNQEFALSDKLLARATASDKDMRLRRLQVRRLFETHRLQDLLDSTAEPTPGASGSDSDVLAYRALALYETGHGAAARPLIQIHDARTDDVSQGWALCLRARYADRPLEPALAIQRFREAIARDPRNPVAHVFLADAHAALGEADQALREWKIAAELSPASPTPLYAISRTLLATGRPAESLDWARRLFGADRSRGSYVALALAWYDLVGPSPDAARSQEGGNLLKFLGEIRANWPAEPDTLPLYVALLARRGEKDKAVEAVNAALALRPPLSDEALGRLARVSDEQQLGLEESILDKAEQAHGVTPAVAFARAARLCESGKKDDALHLMRTLSQSHPNDTVWQIAEARLADRVGDAGAVKLWSALADAHPDDLRVQTEALASPSRATDRAFWRRAIDRVKAITGPDGLLWQLEEARWQLTGNPSTADVERVIGALQNLLHTAPSVADAHMLLADALSRAQGAENASRAVAELTAAHELRPADFEASSRLAQLLASQGATDKAVAVVDEMVRGANLPHDRRLWAAGMYAGLGYGEAAIKLLTEDGSADAQDPVRDALLARLYGRTGRADQATALYKKLLDEPSVGAQGLIEAAEFFAASHQRELCDRFLARLEKVPLSPGTIDVVRANLQEVGGSPEESRQILVAAAQVHPNVEQVWQELAGFYLRHGNLSEADAAAADGLQSIPSSPVLTAMRTEIARIRSIGLAGLSRLIDVVSHDPRNAVTELTLKMLADAAARGESPLTTIVSLRQLADQHVGFLPLQELLVQRYMALGQFTSAAEIASRASALAPRELEPLRLLCAAQMAAGNWEAARQTAGRLRDVSASDPVEADLMIAETYLRQPQPDPDAAVSQLAGYMSDSAPEARRQRVMPQYCQALIAAGRAQDAARLLEPLLSQSSKWRLVWLQLATAHKDADAASNWVSRAGPSIPSHSIAEHVALADAWEQIGTKYDSMAACQRGRDVLRPLIDHPDLPADFWAAWGAINQSLDDLPAAEQAWRKYLAKLPDQPDAQNNLAYVLLLEGGTARLFEAREWSRRAIARAPAVSTYYDTLARIQLHSDQKAEAVKSFRQALALDGRNIEAMIGLADVLQSTPSDRDEARSLLKSIDGAIQSGVALPAPVRQQLQRLKGALSSSM